MRAVIQRVEKANVKVGENIVAEIGHGFLVLLAIHKEDKEDSIKKLADKIIKLRVFEDKEGKMNKSLEDKNGSVLVVSQFTLYGDTSRGRRPSFIESARPEMARDYYEKFCKYLKEKGINTQNGIFQESMKVSLTNDGPTTIIIDI